MATTLFTLLITYITRRFDDEQGQALSEYSITLMLILIVTIAAITAAGNAILQLLQDAGAALSNL